MWVTKYDVEETSGGAYQSHWTEKGDFIDRAKWHDGVYKLSRGTR